MLWGPCEVRGLYQSSGSWWSVQWPQLLQKSGRYWSRLVRRRSLFLAPTRHVGPVRRCPLIAVDRKKPAHGQSDAIDPERNPCGQGDRTKVPVADSWGMRGGQPLAKYWAASDHNPIRARAEPVSRQCHSSARARKNQSSAAACA